MRFRIFYRCFLKAVAYDRALQRFNAALQTGGFNPLIAYNAALCHFRKRENAQAMNYIGKILNNLCLSCL